MDDFVLHGTIAPADDFRMALLHNLMAMLDSAEEDGMASQASCVVADSSKWYVMYFLSCCPYSTAVYLYYMCSTSDSAHVLRLEPYYVCTHSHSTSVSVTELPYFLE